jgi:diguanylate cyclase (GGDEF)-like protein
MTAAAISSFSIVIICLLFGIFLLAAWQAFGLKRYAMLWALSFIAAAVGHGMRIGTPLVWPAAVPFFAMLACHTSIASFTLLAAGFRSRARRSHWPVTLLWLVSTLLLLGFWILDVSGWRTSLRIITGLGDAAMIAVIVATLGRGSARLLVVQGLLAIYGLYAASVGLAAWLAKSGGTAGESFFVMVLSIGTPTGMIGTGVMTLLMVSADLARDLREQAIRDPLTGLLNRRGLEERLGELHRKSGRHATIIALADLDRFKAINDRLGHAVGDEVLKRFPRLLEERVGALGPVARMGGEEFLLLMPDIAPAEARRRIDTLHAKIPVHFPDIASDHPVTASFGVTEHAQREPFQHALSRADAAL